MDKLIKENKIDKVDVLRRLQEKSEDSMLENLLDEQPVNEQDS